jgi:molybdopterin molybdotransferase
MSRTSGLMRINELLAHLIAETTPLTPESVVLSGLDWRSVAGRAIAAPLNAALALPPFDVSAMDGWAVRVEELRGVTNDAPRELVVDGDSAAGGADGARLAPNACRRISTGARIPDGADAVVPVEQSYLTDPRAGAVRLDRVPADLPRSMWFMETPKLGAAIRRRGEDVLPGDALLAPGDLLDAASIAVAAGSGASALLLAPRPRVAIITTGDELSTAIPDTNGPLLEALVESEGARVVMRQRLRDDAAATNAALVVAAREADIVLTTGGVSVGPHDHVGAAIAATFSTVVWRLAIQPGKPLVLGARRPEMSGAQWAFGLPGNPVSAFVTAHELVLPTLRAMQGRPAHMLTERGTLDVAVESPVGRRSFLRLAARRDGAGAPVRDASGAVYVHMAGGQGSHQANVLAQTDYLGIVEEEAAGLAAGAPILLHPLLRAARRR